MKRRVFPIFLIASFVLLTVYVVSQTVGKQNEKYPFAYKAEFGEIRVRHEKRVDFQGEAVKEKWPVDAPAHTCYDFENKRSFPAVENGPRYFFPAYSFICVVPTFEKGETDFTKTFPNFGKAVGQLKKLLEEKPGNFGQFDDLFDFPYNNAGWAFKAKVKYLDFEKIAGVFFITQYSQDLTPTPANNEELTANFQGLSKDGKYYVAARFAILYPSLPRGIDSVDDRIQNHALNTSNVEEIKERVRTYLKREADKIERLSNDTFVPKISSLEQLISSISPPNG
jgi:hypothetical protein